MAAEDAVPSPAGAASALAAPAEAGEPTALTGTLAHGNSGRIRLVIDRPCLTGSDPRLHLELVNEGEEDFTTQYRDTWIVAMSDGRKIGFAPRTEMPELNPNHKTKGRDEPFRSAVVKPYDSLRLMLAPPSPLEGEVASVELRSHDLAASLLAADSYRRAKPRLQTPIVIPADFKAPAESFALHLALIVDPSGKARTVMGVPSTSARNVSGRKEFSALVKTTIAGWTFDPAIRRGSPEPSLLSIDLWYSNHRVVRRSFAVPEGTLAPSLAAYLRATLPLFVELPDLHGFAVAGPLPEGEAGTIGARAWFIRTGETSAQESWIAVGSRTITARDPLNGMKCGCDFITDQENASVGLMDAITTGMGLPYFETAMLMPIDGLIPSGLPETFETGTWEHDAVHKLLHAALVRADEIRKSAQGPEAKANELAKAPLSTDLPAAADFPFRKGAIPILSFPPEEDMTAPVLLTKVTPEYPENARASRIEGNVILGARIDEEGHVKDLEILRGVPGLNLSSIDGVACWKYKPATRGGKPTPVDFTVVVTYSLR
jgi:TonB family protein